MAKGRPSKLTAARRKKLVEGIKLGMTYKIAAQYAGVGESTLHAWLRRGRSGDGRTFVDLYAAIQEAEAMHAALALGSIVKASRDSWQAGAWLLERRHGYNKIGQASTIRDVDELDGVGDANEVTRIRHQIHELRTGNRVALDSGSYQAWIAGKRHERLLLADLAVALGNGGGDPVEDLNSEAFASDLLEAMGHWPDTLLELAIGVYEQRHSIKLLGVIEGGRG